MKDGTVGSRCSKLAAVALGGALLWATPALADPPAAEAPPPGAPPAADAPAPAATPPPPAAPPPPAGAKPADAKPTATEAMPATRPEALPPIDVGAWLRAGSKFQNGTDPSKVNDWQMDQAVIELHAGGKITKQVAVTLNLTSNMQSLFNPPGSDKATEGGSYVAIEDAIIQFDFMDEFHLWAGHLLVPVDRSNASGPFFMIPWNYPGFFTQQPDGSGIAAPHEGPAGRNNGAVVWGDIMGGKFCYFAGAFDNANVHSSPLFSGRLRLALWDPEPGFWGNGSYFGDKDMLSFNVGAQFQQHGSAGMAGDKDYTDINVDALIEKKLGGGAFVTGEGGYYHYNVQDGGLSDTFYVLGAYASPTVGVGNIQPMVRYQWEKVKGPMGTKPWNIDVGLAYLIKGPALRVIATYSHTNLTSAFAANTGTMAAPVLVDSANSVQLGAQAIFF
jgi:hypothetical protein